MALVRISKDLINHVEGRISQLRHAEINEVPMPPTEFASTPGDGVEPLATQILWGEHLHLKSLMPGDWVRKAERIQFVTTYTHDDGRAETSAMVSFTGANVPVPPGVNLGWSAGVTVPVPYDIVEQAVADEQSTFHKAARKVMDIVEREKHGRKVTKAWTERQQQIVLFLNKCKSLNEAIKLWPEVKLYVPQHFIATVETPVVRSQAVVRKERVMENVDTDGLTAAAIAARLAGVI